MIHLRKNYGKFENRLNYTEIVVLESKKRKHSEFMNKLKLRMILWSTAEAVLRQALPRVSQLSTPCTVRAFLHRSGIISPPRFLPSRRTGKRIWISSKDKSPPLTTSARSPRASTNGVNSRPAGTSSAPSCRCSAPTDNGREERSGI